MLSDAIHGGSSIAIFIEMNTISAALFVEKSSISCLFESTQTGTFYVLSYNLLNFSIALSIKYSIFANDELLKTVS